MIQHEYIKVEDFRRVGQSNEYWFWHFTNSKRNPLLAIQPLMGVPGEVGFHPFKKLIEQVKIPVFETKTEDAFDFLISLDPNITARNIFHENNFATIILGFNYMRLVSSTQHPGKCYCSEGIIEIVAEMNIKLLDRFEID